MAMPWRLDECFHRQSGVHMQCLVVEKKSLEVLPLLPFLPVQASKFLNRSAKQAIYPIFAAVILLNTLNTL